MSTELTLCVLIAACLVQISTIACLPDGYTGRDVQGTIPDLQTMTVGKAQELLQAHRKQGQYALNTLTTAGSDDPIVGEKGVVEQYKDDLETTSTVKTQVDQHGDLREGLHDTHGGFRLDQPLASSLLQAVAAKEEVNGRGQKHINLDKTEPGIVQKMEPPSVEDNEPFSVETDEDRLMKTHTASPSLADQDTSVVTTKFMTNRGMFKEAFTRDGVEELLNYDGVKELPIHGVTVVPNHEKVKEVSNYDGVKDVPNHDGVTEAANHDGVKDVTNHEKVKEVSNYDRVKDEPYHEKVKEVANYDRVKDEPNHDGGKEIPNLEGSRQMLRQKDVRTMPKNEEVRGMPTPKEVRGILNYEVRVKPNGNRVKEIPKRTAVQLITNHEGDLRMPSHKAFNGMRSHDGVRVMSSYEDVKGMPTRKTIEGRPYHEDVKVLLSQETIGVRPMHEDVKVTSDNDETGGRPNHEDIKRMPSHEAVGGRPTHEDVKRRPNHEEMADKDNHHTAGETLSGKESSPNFEGIDIPLLTGFGGNKGNVRFLSKILMPAFGEREMNWIIKIQQVVFDGVEDEIQKALKATNDKAHFNENNLGHIKDGLDVFRAIPDGGNRRHLLQFSDKDNPDASSAAKEPEKDKSSPSSDGPDAAAAAATATDGTDETAAGKLSPDSPNLDSTIQKGITSPPVQDQPAGKTYGNNDMLYPFRPDLQNDGGRPSNLKLPADFFSKDNIDSRVEEAMSNLKPNYMLDLFRNRNSENQELDYGTRNDDDGRDGDNFNDLIRAGEDDQRAFKSSQEARLVKRSLRVMPGDDSDASVNDDESEKDPRLYKRSPKSTLGGYNSPVKNEKQEIPKDVLHSRLHKRSVSNLPRDYDASSSDDNVETLKEAGDSRVYKRSVQDLPDVSDYNYNAASAKESLNSRLQERSVVETPGDFDTTVTDDNDGSVENSRVVRLHKRSIEDTPSDVGDDGNDGSVQDSSRARLYKRSVHDVPDYSDESFNDGASRSAKIYLNSRLHKRSVLDRPHDLDASPSDDNEGIRKHRSDTRIYKRSAPAEHSTSGNDHNTESAKDASDSRLLKRSVQNQDYDTSVNDNNKEFLKDPSDARLYKRSVDDVSGKYGVSVNDDDGSPKEYDIETENGVKQMRFPNDEKPLLVKRDVSEAFGSAHQHNSHEKEYQHKHNDTWIEKAVKEARNSDNSVVHHGDNGGKIFVGGEGTPTLVGLVLIPVNSDGTIKEEKEADSSSSAQYHHASSHHRRPCNGSHIHHGLPHSTDHNAGETSTHPCHHGHRKGHHNRHRPAEHHVVGRTDSQPAQGYNTESHRPEDEHHDSHTDKHSGAGHRSAHKDEYEKDKPRSEGSGGFHNRDGESHSYKSHNGEHGGRRDEIIVESIRTEQITSGHSQRAAHAGNAVHVLVILSIFLICFTVILFLIVRSRSGSHVREINSRTALYVPQAKY